MSKPNQKPAETHRPASRHQREMHPLCRQRSPVRGRGLPTGVEAAGGCAPAASPGRGGQDVAPGVLDESLGQGQDAPGGLQHPRQAELGRDPLLQLLQGVADELLLRAGGPQGSFLPLPARSGRRRHEPAGGEPDEGDDVVLVLDGEPEVGPGEEEVEAERGRERRGHGGATAAELRDEDGERHEGEGEVGRGGELAQRYEQHAEEQGHERASRQVEEPVAVLARHVYPRSAGRPKRRSRSRFRRRTLTRGSPSRPNVRSSVRA